MFNVIKNNLRGFAAKQRMIFAFIVLSQFISILLIMFVYYNVTNQLNINESFDIKERLFIISPHYSFDSALDKSLNATIDNVDNMRNITVTLRQKGSIINAPVFFPDKCSSYVAFGKYFSEEDFNSGANHIIICDTLTKGLKKIGDTFLVNGTDYEIIGFFQKSKFHEIPYNSIKTYEDITEISVELEKVPNKKEIDGLKKILKTNFGNVDVITPTLPNKLRTLSVTVNRYMSTCAMGLLSLINIAFLYNYICLIRKKQFASLRICGCSKLIVTVVYLSEVMIITFIQFIICGILFKAVLSPLFYGVNATTVSDYIALFTIYFVLVLLVFIPTLLRYNLKTPVELRRNSFV